MELITKDGLKLISQDDIDTLGRLKAVSLKVRLSIIAYNRTKNENNLNSCCRNCNDIVTLVTKLFDKES